MQAVLARTETVAVVLVGTPLLYLCLVAGGRFLKRRAGVHLGLSYQILCIILAVLAPLRLVGVEVFLQRELSAAATLLGALFAIALTQRYLWEGYFEKTRQTAAPTFLRDLVALLIFLGAVALVLTVGYGQTVPGLLAGSGIAAIIIGLAMQDLLGNIVSGVAIEMGRPFRPGDWLIVDGTTHAQVTEINWRSTRLRTNDDVYLDIPNNKIVRDTIVNLSYPTPTHAIRLQVGIDYAVPPNEVREALLHATCTAQGVLQTPPPKVFLKDFGDSAIQYEIKFSLVDHKHRNDILDAVRTNMWYELRRRQITIPFPIRTVHLERPARRAEGIEVSARQALRAQPLFASLDDAHLDQLLDAARPQRYGRRERIIEQGREGDSMFILLQGRAQVMVSAPGAAPGAVATLRPGDCFGEMSLLTGETRSATVVAETDCHVMEIEKGAFARIVQANAEVLQQLSELLAKRKLEMEGVLASAAASDITARQREYTASFLGRLYRFFEL